MHNGLLQKVKILCIEIYYLHAIHTPTKIVQIGLGHRVNFCVWSYFCRRVCVVVSSISVPHGLLGLTKIKPRLVSQLNLRVMIWVCWDFVIIYLNSNTHIFFLNEILCVFGVFFIDVCSLDPNWHKVSIISSDGLATKQGTGHYLNQ